jgi:hypothetical protein
VNSQIAKKNIKKMQKILENVQILEYQTLKTKET